MARKATYYIGEAEAELVKRVSEEEGLSQGALVTRALRSFFEARRKKARSIGAGRSGRKDLSEKAEELLEGLGEDR